ncbi:MAG: HEAT repeat domain-containing protein [Planctomycetaceae bacterium]|nr:HEAT repeat domain-containing protein [Planctomycetaceae bacterium]
MARRDVSQNDSSYSPQLFDTLMLAGFLGVFSVFVAIVTFQPSESPEPAPVVETVNVPIQPQVVPNQAPEISLKAVKNLQARRLPRVVPAAISVVSKPETALPEPPKAVLPVVPAAVAEKPKSSILVASHDQTYLSKLMPRTELELERDLSDSVTTVGLNLAQSESLVTVLRTKPPAIRNNPLEAKPTETVLAMLPKSAADGLPFAESSDCKLDYAAARHLETYSKYLHEQITKTDESIKRRFPTSSAARRDEMMANAIGQDRKCQSPEAVPSLMQILQVESTPIRQEVIGLLSDNHTPQTTKALANRAVFDLSPEVRQEARQALRERTTRDYRPELLEALRYPWSPAAWHAAETLVAVQDKKAVPALIELLDTPEPTMPFRDKNGKLVVRELVRINHAQNCLLCHAPSRSEKDPVRGFVPLPRSRAYYADRKSGVLVRADVTYLRQDFSVIHDVDISKAGTNLQRFDYLVRTREATEKEQLMSYGKATTPAETLPSYPQREAVLFALRELTGRDYGTKSEDWRKSQELLAESW